MAAEYAAKTVRTGKRIQPLVTRPVDFLFQPPGTMAGMTTRFGSLGRYALVISTVFAFGLAGLLGCGGAASQGGEGQGPAPKTAERSDLPVDPSTGEVVEDVSFLDILSEPPTDVLLDGKPAGKTPIKNFKVTPGPHDVTFVDEAEGNRTMSVNVQPGDHETVKLDRVPSIKEQK